MLIQDIQAAVIGCRIALQESLKLIKQCEADLQDQNIIEDLEKKLRRSGELANALAMGQGIDEEAE